MTRDFVYIIAFTGVRPQQSRSKPCQFQKDVQINSMLIEEGTKACESYQTEMEGNGFSPDR